MVIYRLDDERYKKWRAHVKYMVGSLRDIKTKIIPFFRKYPPMAKKRKQFEYFCKVAKIIEIDEHKTLVGIEKIRNLRTEFYKA